MSGNDPRGFSATTTWRIVSVYLLHVLSFGRLSERGAGAGLLFKGSGFYITDYAKKNIPDKENRPKDKPKAEKSGESKAGSEAAETVSSKKAGPDKPTPDR